MRILNLIPYQLALKLEGIKLILTKLLKDYPIPESELIEGMNDLAGIIDILDNNASKLRSVAEIAENFRPALKILELRSINEYSIKEVEQTAEEHYIVGLKLFNKLLTKVSFDELG